MGLILGRKILAGLFLALMKKKHTSGFSIICQTVAQVSSRNSIDFL